MSTNPWTPAHLHAPAHLGALVVDDGLRGGPLRGLAMRERAAIQPIRVVRQPV